MIRSRVLLVVMIAALLGALVLPMAAQEETGGIAITGTFGAGPDTFSQVYCTGTDCADIVGYMYMGLVGVDPETATIEPNQPGALAESWEVSDDNKEYTVTLRQDAFWSDGEQITSEDVLYHWELLNNEEVGHPDAFILEEIANVEAVDDFTVKFTMNSPACSALNFIGGVPPVPAHVLSNYEPSELESADINLAPEVTSGAFTFGNFRPSESTTLIADKDYVDAPEGGVSIDGFIQRVSPDQNVMIEQLLGGELNFLEGISSTRQDEIREAEGVQVFEYAGNTWDYMAFNLADPENPQPALDEDGNRIDQGLHPLFSDKMVRQAIGHAVNVDDIIQGAVFGNGTRMASNLVPASWAYDDTLEPRSYDTAIALEMLAEAGWVPGEDGNLVCEGCLYATEVDPAFEGSPFEFTLYTNAGNTRREAIGAVVQDQLSEIGIAVDFQTVEFNTLLEIMDAQSFDAFILGWRNGYPDDPNTIQLFGAEADVPGSGFNFTSFYNEAYFELEEAANTVAGCSNEDRAAIYAEMQAIMYDEMPYLWLFSENGMYVAGDNVNGFAPYPNNIDWNMLSWAVLSE